MKQYQLIAKQLHKVKPLALPTKGYNKGDVPYLEGCHDQWEACVESIADELSDQMYRPEFLLIADTGKVPDAT